MISIVVILWSWLSITILGIHVPCYYWSVGWELFDRSETTRAHWDQGWSFFRTGPWEHSWACALCPFSRKLPMPQLAAVLQGGQIMKHHLDQHVAQILRVIPQLETRLLPRLLLYFLNHVLFYTTCHNYTYHVGYQQAKNHDNNQYEHFWITTIHDDYTYISFWYTLLINT